MEYADPVWPPINSVWGREMNELMFGLLLWVNQNTAFNYDGSAGMPDVQRVDVRTLSTLMFKGDTSAALSPRNLRIVSEQIEAIYHPETKTIYVRNSVDLDTVYGKSALVHELVHYIQYQQSKHTQVACINALEKDAYHVQSAYLRDKGEEPRVDDFTVAVRSLCYR